MSGTLFVVATPIGNLEDITWRAVRVLREAQLIAAEDTRRTAGLLAHFGISTPSISFHAHNSRSRLPGLLARLQAGDHVALVSDAGTPGVSDPGVELVQACVAAGITVDPVPGVSAPLAAALASGFPLIPLTVYGFPPTRSKDRKHWIQELSAVGHTLTFFEAPHRIRTTLREAADYLAERPIMVGRELTKLHQEFLYGTAASLAERLAEPRGEFTVVVGPRPHVATAEVVVDDETIAEKFGLLTNSLEAGRRAAVAAVARELGRPVNEIYAALERHKR